jgi:histidinol-phosphate aminotransferase
MSTRLARPEILELRAYESARSLTTEGKVFLDANESPVSPLDFPNLNRYPEPQPKALVERLGSLYSVPREKLMIGRGSDEAIDLIVRVFCRAGQDQILICPPTYGMYEISAKIQGAGILRVPMILDGENSRLDEAAILAALEKNSDHTQTGSVKIIFLCSPNNPTGSPFALAALTRICKATIDKAIVVIDEAYGEFSDDQSMMAKVDEFSNLVVLRTLSKAWAIAGARCGVAISSPPLIALLQKVRAPYPLSLPAIQTILAATDERHHQQLQIRIQEIKNEKARMIAELNKMQAADLIYPSATNFFLARFKNPPAILQKMKSQGVVLRDRSHEAGLEHCIRITVGTPAENNQVLRLIQESIAGDAS